MQLLVDTDLFCKLGIAQLFGDTLISLGVQENDVSRLPALPHMLRRGSLPRTFGAEACLELVPIAERLTPIGAPDALWLDQLTPIQAIDPGEAQLFASAAHQSLVILSGDKRAIREIKNIPNYVEALSGRIIVLEAILIHLCDRMGDSELRRRLKPLIGKDTMVNVCFSDGNNNPREALVSYYQKLVTEVHPLVLWDPHCGAAL